MHVRVIVRMQQRSHFIRHRQFELRPLLIVRFGFICTFFFVIVRSSSDTSDRDSCCSWSLAFSAALDPSSDLDGDADGGRLTTRLRLPVALGTSVAARDLLRLFFVEPLRSCSVTTLPRNCECDRPRSCVQTKKSRS